jgi:predicted Zn-dependent protease
VLRAIADPGDDATWRFGVRAVAESPVDYVRYCVELEQARRENEPFFEALTGGSRRAGDFIARTARDELLGGSLALDPRVFARLAPDDRATVLDVAARQARLAGDSVRALALLKEAVACAPRNAPILVSYASALASQGDRKLAVRVLSEA